MGKAGLYIRVSTEMQVQGGESLQTQKERLLALSKAKRWHDYKIYEDAGLSAKNLNRPKFQEMIADIKRGHIGVIACTKLDRMFRNTKDFLETMDLFEKHHVEFICLDADIDTTTPAGRVFSTMRAAFAQFERETTAERVRDAMLARAQKGEWNGGIIPYGFKYNPQRKHLEINKGVEIETVQKIFELFIEKQTFRGATIALNGQGFRTREGELWSINSVRRVLQNPMYCGAITYNKRRTSHDRIEYHPKEKHLIIPNVFEPIINPQIFERVQEIIKGRKTVPSNRKTIHKLSGILYCGACGDRLQGAGAATKAGNFFRYYRCTRASNHGNQYCQADGVCGPCLDGLIENELKGFAINPDRLERFIKKYEEQFTTEVAPVKERLAHLQTAFRELESQKKRSLELYEKELLSLEEFAERKRELDSQQKGLREEIERLEAQLEKSKVGAMDTDGVRASFNTLKEVYDELSPEEQKELLHALIEKIVVRKVYSNRKRKHTPGHEICPMEVTYSVYLAPFMVAVAENRTGTGSSPPPA